MPRDARGLQLVTFSIEKDDDQSFRKWIWVDVKKGDSVAKVAARRGHPEDARAIADENGIRSVNSEFSGRGKTKIKVPGELRASLSFDVLAGDAPPTIVGGYAKLTIVNRPGRVGLSVPDGYDPSQMDVPIRFEGTNGEGLAVERDIALLERMAGRGNFDGTAVGDAPVIRLSTTGPNGEVVPLIPRNYQWSLQNKTGPLWLVNGIDWDDTPSTGVRRNGAGNRTRQLAIVHVQQYTHIDLLSRSVVARAKTKTKTKAKKK